MNRAYHKWFSPALGREMELLVFGHGGRAVLFFPTRMARFYDYENWGIVGALYERIASGQLQLFCVDSIDAESFYNKEIEPAQRINRHLQYENYLLNEVIPFMRAQSGGNNLEVAGCSMGAFHAVNLGLKHPHIFNKVVGMSGRYDLTVQLENYDDLLDGYRSQDVYFNMPQQFVSNMHDDTLLNRIRHLEIILAVGQTDPFYTGNSNFSKLLWSKNLPHNFYVWNDNAHRPRFWRQMVQLYL
jgi:esterase/lipase superfamily enzyme